MHRVSSLRVLLPTHEKRHWTFTLTIAVLLCGSVLSDSYQSFCLLANNSTECNSNLLLIVINTSDECNSDCSHCPDSNGQHCQKLEIKKDNDEYKLILDTDTFNENNITLMFVKDQNLPCVPSALYKEAVNEIFLNLDKCIEKTSGVNHFNITKNNCSGNSAQDASICQDDREGKYVLTVSSSKLENCVLCKSTSQTSTPPPTSTEATPKLDIHPVPSDNGTINAEKAAELMGNLSSFLEQLGNASTGIISAGNIKGLIHKLPAKNPKKITIGFSQSGDIGIDPGETDLNSAMSRSVQISKEASAMAVNRNGSFVGVLLFPGISKDEKNSILLDNSVVGIEMGVPINNLSETIDIHYSNVDKNGGNVSCNSWNGHGKIPEWSTDGCQTQETNNSITCQCTHLSFFAILLSPPPANISASDVKSLTYITSIGCSLSMFFLAVALFMHCVIRRGKSSQATKILTHLFVAMFFLNLTFLINESIANLGNFGVCIFIAALMHYTMLATFSWFFAQALHLYLQLRKVPTEIKHYIVKICVIGWVTPALVVIAIGAAGKYDYMVINTNDGNSVKMCWISDANVHQGVNIGYYAVVFVFTFTVFIMVVRHILLLKPAAAKSQESTTAKTNTFSILGLVLLLGITWAFAFFSYGPLVIPSYYIFSILNSFQGFFLFIYYHNSNKTYEKARGSAVSSSSSTATSNTIVSPYAPQQ